MDHELRQTLAGEAHARPSVPVSCPSLVLHEARTHDDNGAAARAHAEAIARAHGLPPPPREVDHMLLALPMGDFKWERHGEFSAWTLVRNGVFDPASPVAAPAELLDAPGRRFAAAAVYVSAEPPSAMTLDRALGPESAEAERAGSLISSELAGVWTGFRIGEDGWTRFLLTDRGLGRFRAGRVVRRLLEIETYRIAALLAFPIAKAARREIDALELKVGAAIAARDVPERDVLDELIDAAREIERIAQATAFRFGAAGAYRRLVEQRLEEFREVRIEGLQRMSAFLDRRFAPAMDTCAATQSRLETLAKRVERASGMLRTRIDLAVEMQNQKLLESMNDNAKAQLRVQNAVEGFSVAAISYYAWSLISKALAPVLALAGAGKPLFETILVISVVGAVWAILWRLRGRL